jgi:hypothetical protein
MAYLQIRENSKRVMLDQFVNDFNIAEAIFENNLDEYSLFHSTLNLHKADRKDKIEDIEFSC